MWFTTDCFDEKPYVCELPALILPTSSTRIPPTTTSVPIDATTTDFTTEEFIETTTTLGPPIYTCDGGWSQFNETHFCFKTFTKNVFDDAEGACKSFGGHLASIHSAAELAFVNTLLDNTYYWLGLCTTDNGMTWTWTDGTSTADFALDHWCGDGPQHSANTCVVYNTPSMNCFTNIRKSLPTNGLCKKPANVSYGSI
uniref:C-type lectin domain-containing protein n=1 Tax=Panagrolaimus davidi TaxID=227884 RepID=A0A914PWE9_9BILA